MNSLYQTPESPDGWRWWQPPPSFFVDTSRVNLRDLECALVRPGTIVRVTHMSGLPIVPFGAGNEKWYPIEDEL